MKNLKVRDLMTESVYSLTPDDSLEDLFEAMTTRRIRHVPIVGKGGEVLGLVSHRDLVGAVNPEGMDLPLANRTQALEEMTINDIMKQGVETVDPDQDIITAAGLMLENKLGCLPVVEGDELVGILTESDFVRWVADTSS